MRGMRLEVRKAGPNCSSYLFPLTSGLSQELGRNAPEEPGGTVLSAKNGLSIYLLFHAYKY